MPNAPTSVGSAVHAPVAYWGLIPHGMTFGGEATAVAVDEHDRVHVFNRGSHPLMTFSADGHLLQAHAADEEGWDQFQRPHGVASFGDALFLVDEGAHVVEKRSLDGTLQFVLGERGAPAPPYSGRPFNRPTDIAQDPVSGDLFVSDGYRNASVHRYDAKGRHLNSWGRPGSGPGEFSVPHSVCVTADRRVLVCDRENFRVQVFTVDGELLDIWSMHRPTAVRTRVRDGVERIYVAEAGPPPMQRGVPRLGNCVWMLDSDGARLERIGDPVSGTGVGQLIATHMVAVDSQGGVYVAECSGASVAKYAPQDLPPPGTEMTSLRKWQPVHTGADEPGAAPL